MVAPTTDNELLRLYAREGSQDAFAQLVERHLPMVHRTAWRLLSQDDHRARDVAQQVFVRLGEQSGKLVHHTRLAGWLHRTAHHIACEMMRTENRRRRREAALALETEDKGDEIATDDWDRIRGVLDGELSALAEKDREAIVQRFFQDRPYAELGRGLGVSEDAARMRVTRALDRLRGRLAKRGVKASGAGLGALLAADGGIAAPAGLAELIVAGTKGAAVVTSLGMTGYLVATAAWVVALVSVGVSVQERVTLANLRSQWANAQRTLHAEEQGAADRSTLMAPSEAIARPTVAAAEKSAATPTDPMAAERARGDAFLASHPEVRAALLDRQKSQVLGRWGVFFHQENVAPAQISALEELLRVNMDFYRPDVGLLQVGSPMEGAEREGRLRALLGNEGFERLRSANTLGNSIPGAVARRISEKLALSVEPLNSAQSRHIVDLLTRIRTSRADELDWEVALPEIEAILTPAQRVAAQAVAAEDRYREIEKAKFKAVEVAMKGEESKR